MQVEMNESEQKTSNNNNNGNNKLSKPSEENNNSNNSKTNNNNNKSIDIDQMISKLLSVRGSRPGKEVTLLEKDIVTLCTQSQQLFIEQPILLELAAPIKVVGDIHGQYYDLLRLFEYGQFPPESNYLFLGDYVDRGKQSLESICLLLAYKLKYAENFFILRGNHECASINRIYGFFDECKRRYSMRLWKTFTDCFNCLPVAAIVDEKICCMHGGLSPENERGVSYTFVSKVVSKFLRKHDLDLICRAHQVVEDGYEFFAKRQLVTVFSAPNYCGEFDNAGAMMSVDSTLMCSGYSSLHSRCEDVLSLSDGGILLDLYFFNQLCTYCIYIQVQQSITIFKQSKKNNI